MDELLQGGRLRPHLTRKIISFYIIKMCLSARRIAPNHDWYVNLIDPSILYLSTLFPINNAFSGCKLCEVITLKKTSCSAYDYIKDYRMTAHSVLTTVTITGMLSIYPIDHSIICYIANKKEKMKRIQKYAPTLTESASVV